jgi:hypothetical protein
MAQFTGHPRFGSGEQAAIIPPWEKACLTT